MVSRRAPRDLSPDSVARGFRPSMPHIDAYRGVDTTAYCMVTSPGACISGGRSWRCSACWHVPAMAPRFMETRQACRMLASGVGDGRACPSGCLGMRDRCFLKRHWSASEQKTCSRGAGRRAVRPELTWTSRSDPTAELVRRNETGLNDTSVGTSRENHSQRLPTIPADL